MIFHEAESILGLGATARFESRDDAEIAAPVPSFLSSFDGDVSLARTAQPLDLRLCVWKERKGCIDRMDMQVGVTVPRLTA